MHLLHLLRQELFCKKYLNAKIKAVIIVLTVNQNISFGMALTQRLLMAMK